MDSQPYLKPEMVAMATMVMVKAAGVKTVNKPIVIVGILIVLVSIVTVITTIQQIKAQDYSVGNDSKIKTVTIVQGAHNPDNGQFYNPSTITVEPQTKIIWKNEDMVREDEIVSEVQHTAVSGERGRPSPSHGETMMPDGIFDTGFILQGQSSLPTEMPSTPGVYPYFCVLHPFMNGTVIVK